MVAPSCEPTQDSGFFCLHLEFSSPDDRATATTFVLDLDLAVMTAAPQVSLGFDHGETEETAV